jgi:hypothetical protein
MGRPTRHLRALLVVVVLLACTLTTQSHHVSTPPHPGRAAHIHAPQHAPSRPAGRDGALPLGSIDPRETRLARPLRWDNGPSAVAALLAHRRTRGPPPTELVVAEVIVAVSP